MGRFSASGRYCSEQITESDEEPPKPNTYLTFLG